MSFQINYVFEGAHSVIGRLSVLFKMPSHIQFAAVWTVLILLWLMTLKAVGITISQAFTVGFIK